MATAVRLCSAHALRIPHHAIQTGNIGLTGATRTMLHHSLLELGALSDWALSEIRLASAATTLSRP